MNRTDFDGKTLHVDMKVRPENEEKLIHIQGVGRLSASGSYVTVDWFTNPPGTGRSITLNDASVEQIRPNTDRKEFSIRGTSLTPDFIYIDAS